MDEQARAVARTRAWLERCVIGLGLCPFAAAPYRDERILYVVCAKPGLEAIYRTFLQTLERMLLTPPEELETALLVVSRGLTAFDDYLDALSVLERALQEGGFEGVIQLASFHPEYRFAGAPEQDPANYTNRSPLPLFHLIREQGLAEALASYSDPEGIPERNIRRLRQLGIGGIRALCRET